jgi:hypothetical protein
VADIWGFDESTEKSIGVHWGKPHISTTAKMRSKFHLRERLQETPDPTPKILIFLPDSLRSYKTCWKTVLQFSGLIYGRLPVFPEDLFHDRDDFTQCNVGLYSLYEHGHNIVGSLYGFGDLI